VVATDLHGQSEAALEYARKLATNYGARIVLAHGLDPLEYADVDGVPGRVRTGLPEAAREVWTSWPAICCAREFIATRRFAKARWRRCLWTWRASTRAGLIVIGTKGLQGAGPVVVGAIAEQLVRLAPCPVMAVAADWNAGEFRPTPGGPVMLAMERNEATTGAVASAYSLAKVFKRPLLVVHARTAAEASALLNPCAHHTGRVWHQRPAMRCRCAAW
jgi:nucleotide-binding universal stress UspA family protein